MYFNNLPVPENGKDRRKRQFCGPSVQTKNVLRRSERVVQLPSIIKSMASIKILNESSLLA